MLKAGVSMATSPAAGVPLLSSRAGWCPSGPLLPALLAMLLSGSGPSGPGALAADAPAGAPAGAAAAAGAPAPAAVGALPASVICEHITLSHTDPKRCLDLLRVFNYQTCEPGKPLDPTSLPCVMVMPSTTNHELPDEKKTFPQTDTDPVTDMLVFYDARSPDQLSQLVHRIRTTVDVPARQIMIEAMVLEIASTDLEELGVQWDLDRSALSDQNWLNKHTTGALRIGNLALPDGTAMADPTVDVTVERIFGDFQAQLQALIIAKSARVLSRPSVLTLDSRMAYINVSEKIPVAESKFAGANTFTQVSFREVTAGIELTVRPRVSEDGSEIGMQISASVSARKPGEDVVIYATDSKGDPFEVARSPTLSVREVKTFARIADNTPFIIGGLVAEDDQKMERKVPLLGNVPFLGALFRTREETTGRREVIIVITPHVLPDNRSVARSLPKDADDFDSFGAELFRDAYRIRSEDVFSLEFLTQNRQLVALQKAADQVVEDHVSLANAYPFSSFNHGRVPGERILVHRQIYEVIKRRELAEPIDGTRLIFLRTKGPGTDISVGRLANHLDELAREEPGFAGVAAAAAAKSKGNPAPGAGPAKALAMTFTEQRDSEAVRDVLREPVPELQVMECPDRDAWREALWQLNQPTESGQQRFSVLLRDPEDLVRLKRAIVLRQAVDMNAQTRELTLRNFSLGSVLLMPTVSPDKVYLIDSDVARCFFYTEHYYRAVGQALDKDIRALEEALKDPDLKPDREEAPKAAPAAP